MGTVLEVSGRHVGQSVCTGIKWKCLCLTNSWTGVKDLIKWGALLSVTNHFLGVSWGAWSLFLRFYHSVNYHKQERKLWQALQNYLFCSLCARLLNHRVSKDLKRQFRSLLFLTDGYLTYLYVCLSIYLMEVQQNIWSICLVCTYPNHRKDVLITNLNPM